MWKLRIKHNFADFRLPPYPLCFDKSRLLSFNHKMQCFLSKDFSNCPAASKINTFCQDLKGMIFLHLLIPESKILFAWDSLGRFFDHFPSITIFQYFAHCEVKISRQLKFFFSLPNLKKKEKTQTRTEPFYFCQTWIAFSWFKSSSLPLNPLNFGLEPFSNLRSETSDLKVSYTHTTGYHIQGVTKMSYLFPICSRFQNVSQITLAMSCILTNSQCTDLLRTIRGRVFL